MQMNPFSPTLKTQDAISPPRRSSRIEFITPVFLSGRDAAGQPFRELTQTSLVNLHGCRLRTSYRVLVGMLVTLECARAGTTGKAVCVKVWEPIEGAAGFEIAVQLIKPQNLWGVPNPPADWLAVAKNLVQGRTAHTEHLPRGAVPAPGSTAAMPPRITPPAAHAADQRLADFERRSHQVVESILNILRAQAEELTRSSLEEFRAQVDALLRDAEQRLREGFQQAYDEAAAALVALRTDLTDQINAHGAQLIRSAEEVLRNHFRELAATQATPAPLKTDQPSSQK